MSIAFSIAVKPHIRRYLGYHFQEPYKLDRNDFFGNWLFYAMRGNKQDEAMYETRLNGYTDKFTLLIGRYYIFSMGVSKITPELICNLNGYIDGLIKHQFVNYMLIWENIREIQVSVECFKDIYGFTEDELKSDALKKYWYRHRRCKEHTI
jgi:hypothetical protein